MVGFVGMATSFLAVLVEDSSQRTILGFY